MSNLTGNIDEDGDLYVSWKIETGEWIIQMEKNGTGVIAFLSKDKVYEQYKEIVFTNKEQ